MKRLFILYLILSMMELSQAQDNETSTFRMRSIGIQFSTAIPSFREDLLVPLGFHGPGFSLGGAYTSQTEKHALNIRLKLGMAYMKNRYSHEAWALIFELRPSFVKKLADHPKYGSIWGGLSIPLQMNNLFFDSWDDSHLYWLTAYSMAIAAEWQKKMSRNIITAIRIEIPVLGWVSRPPEYRYNKQDALTHLSFHFAEPNKSLHFETLDDYQALFFQLFLKNERKRSVIKFGYEFQYNHFCKPEGIWGFNSSILFSYQWRIGS